VSGMDELLTIEEVIAELRVPRSTFYRWRQRGTAPPAVKLPSGAVRISRAALTRWLRSLQDNPEETHPHEQL
jgi:excisionase family DNA binding protein